MVSDRSDPDYINIHIICGLEPLENLLLPRGNVENHFRLVKRLVTILL